VGLVRLLNDRAAGAGGGVRNVGRMKWWDRFGVIICARVRGYQNGENGIGVDFLLLVCLLGGWRKHISLCVLLKRVGWVCIGLD
jgi:hypothetical protein